MDTRKQPSASTKPVTNQGFNGKLLEEYERLKIIGNEEKLLERRLVLAFLIRLVPQKSSNKTPMR